MSYDLFLNFGFRRYVIYRKLQRRLECVDRNNIQQDDMYKTTHSYYMRLLHGGNSMRVALTIAFLLLAMAPCSFAQNDAGNPDTVDLVFSVLPDFTTNQLQVQMDLYVYNDANSLIGSSMGFSWSNPNLQLDSAAASAFTETNFDLGTFFYEDNDIALTNVNQRCLFGSASLFGALPSSPTRELWASYYFTLSNWDVCDTISIDTLQFSPSSVWTLVAAGNLSYQAQWTGRKVIRDTACAVSANLVLSQDSLFFQGVVGGSTPPGQTFMVISDSSPIGFTVHETIPWMVVSPTVGITTQVINVLPNTIGLGAGLYVDSIQIQSTEALNSPVYAKIVLQMDLPPAEILATPNQLIFNAVAGGANPASKILTITNTGGLTLNWSVSNAESWLSLAPTSGTDSGDVTVSVDITGLSFADYEDTIWIADPSASNSPQPVPVFLTVGSDLPIIVADSAFNFVVVPTGTRAVDPGKVMISNGGAGTMTFWTEENSTRLFTITPGSGTAPQELTIEYKLTSGSAGDNFFDTLWIFSNEAINSPLPVVFQFHLVENPALMGISNDTASLTLFECDQGIDGILPIVDFQVSNLGGDNPMPITVVQESDLYTMTVSSPVAPAIVRLFANFLDLPVGIYLDTIEIVAPTSINNPDTVIVKYEVIPGTHAPAISLSRIDIVIPSQENAGPTPPVAFDIRNIWGGCMDWTLQEDIVWLNPSDTAGTAPSGISLGADATGFLFGQYQDSFFVYAPGATITPRKVDVTLKVWRFHGDNDYSGEINVDDLTYLVRYLFLSGPMPQPQFFVGNLDCNHTVDVDDLTYFVNYLFKYGPVPCGNPYK